MKRLLAILLLSVIVWSCQKIMPQAPADEDILAGPLPELTQQELALHLVGDVEFAASFSAADGLGPIFVQASCESCHVGDGKGSPVNRLTRFGRYIGTTWDPMLDQGGPQLQHRAIAGVTPESVPSTATGVSHFIAPNVTGLGFLEAVSDAALLSLADPADSDGDGISGRVHYVDAPSFFQPASHHIPDGMGRYIGRFGRKAGAIDLLQQTVGAYKEDMGISSEYDPTEPNNFKAGDQAPEPEVAATIVDAVVFYIRTLKAPPRRNENDANVKAGELLFEQVGCNGCHTPSMKTGPSPLEDLNYKVFHAYTDLLLHDMGPELDDGYAEGSATSSEWRTSPLWGLGLQHESQGDAMFMMHDGRATTFDQAIQLHGGEAGNSRAAYNALSNSEQEKIIEFLKSL